MNFHALIDPSSHIGLYSEFTFVVVNRYLLFSVYFLCAWSVAAVRWEGIGITGAETWAQKLKSAGPHSSQVSGPGFNLRLEWCQKYSFSPFHNLCSGDDDHGQLVDSQFSTQIIEQISFGPRHEICFNFFTCNLSLYLNEVWLESSSPLSNLAT